MKNLKTILFVCMLVFLNTTIAQNVCEGNLITNGDVEQGPLGSDEVDNCPGFNSIWSGFSSADIYQQGTGAGGMTPPTPTSGNYISLWIQSAPHSYAGWREGFSSSLSSPLLANSGDYVLDFDLANLWMTNTNTPDVEIGIYGISSQVSVPTLLSPTDVFTPSNMNLFPNEIVLLGTISVTGIVNNNWQSQSINFTTNGLSISDISSIAFTKSDNLIGWGAGGGKRYMAFDNFCLTQQEDTTETDYCCDESENLVIGGNFETSTFFSSDYSLNSNPFPGMYTVGTNTNGLAISPLWDVEDHSFCTIGSSNSNFLMVNGHTQQATNSEAIVWEQNIFTGPGQGDGECKRFRVCANFKNMPTTSFDILPQVALRVTGQCGTFQTPFQTINTTSSPCDWSLVSFVVDAIGAVDYQIVIKEDGNGDGNDLAIDDISFQELEGATQPFTVQHDGSTGVITASVNTISPSDDAFKCEVDYRWYVAEITGLPAQSNIIWSTYEIGNNFGSSVGSPWFTTTTFPGYTFQQGHAYIIGLIISENAGCCLAGSESFQITSYSENLILDEEDERDSEIITKFKKIIDSNGKESSELVLDKKIKLSVFPNPANDFLNISLSESAIRSFKITDVLGEIVLEGNVIESKKESISIDELTKGAYFITVNDENGNFHTQKFIKK